MSSPTDQPIRRYLKVPQNDLSDYWFDAYGWIACYFAQLEGLTYSLIEILAPDEDKAQLMGKKYQPRTKIAKRLVCEYLTARGEAELAEEWSMFLKEAKEAGPKRNNILHNPLTVRLALANPLHDADAGIVLTREPDKPILKLGEVQAFSEDMRELNLRMQKLLTRSASHWPSAN